MSKVRGETSHRKAILTGILDLAIDDDRSVEAFCALHPDYDNGTLPSPGPLDPLLPVRARKRLACAQKLVRAILDGVCKGTEEDWIRLETALREIETPRQKGVVMRLRGRVVEVLSGCSFVWKQSEPDLRASIADLLIERLSEVASVFGELDPSVVVETMNQDIALTMRAALLSLSVGAFGDTISPKRLERAFAAAWKARQAVSGRERQDENDAHGRRAARAFLAAMPPSSPMGRTRTRAETDAR